MRSSRAWKGELHLLIHDSDGVAHPQGIPVEFYSRVKKQRNESFKTLDPKHKRPIRSAYIDIDGNEVDRDACLKGVETAKDTYAVMTPGALEQIAEGEKPAWIPSDQFVPLNTVALDLAIDRYAVVPDEDVEGAPGDLNAVWNGLRHTETAWVHQCALRGGHDAILVIYADDRGLWAAALPFEDELYPYPSFVYDEDQAEGETFARFLDKQQEVEDFDISSYTSEYRSRRKTIINNVLEGKDVQVAAPPKAKTSKVSLFDALDASVKPKKAAKKPRAKKAA